MAIDVARLLEPISPEAPCGANLEYDAAYLELETAAERKPEQQFGETIIPAEEPDWQGVLSRAADLLARTKDLRIAAYLTQAALRTEGIRGFRDATALLSGYIGQYWEGVHPLLDPDDDFDPTLRVNVLAGLTNVGGILNPLRDAPLVRSPSFGRFSLRQVAVAHGTEPAPAGGVVPKAAEVDAAFMECDLGELQETAAAIVGTLEHVRGVEAALNDRVGPGTAPDFGALVAALKEARKTVDGYLGRRVAAAPAAAEPGADGAESAVTAAAAPAPIARGGIHSREDVMRALDDMCRWFERHEPSSPVPMLLARARRLIDKDFVSILQDLIPDAVTEAEKLRGPGG